MPERLVWDTESDGVYGNATKIHSVQIGTIDGEDATVYCDALPGFPPIAAGIARLKAAEFLVGQNIYKHDIPLVEEFYPGTIDPVRCFDTLVAVRLANPEEKVNGLAEWGIRLGVRKGDFKGPWDVATPEMMDYARQDIPSTRAMYRHVMKLLDGWGSSIETEQRFAWLMALQERNGFLLDVPAAQALEAEFRGELAVEREKLRDVFPPRYVPVFKKGELDIFTPSRSDRSAGYVAGAPLCRVKLEVFNPGSRQQVASRLKGLGWKPKAFGKDGTPTVNDDILMTLPWPEARRLQTYFTIDKKLGQISEGRESWLKHVKPTGRVHGSVNTVGCAPGRCSHASPNMAQVNKKDLRMRKVWKARPGWKLVGCDGEGLQARALSHYLARYDGGSYVQKIISGNKKLKTDEHASNLQALPFLSEAYNAEYGSETYSKARDGAKTCLYCVLFGGQDPKLGRTLREAIRDAALPMPPVPERELGRQARAALFRAIRGFDKLAETIRAAVIANGFLKGIDGRKVYIRSKHSALVFLMQAFEAAVMKLAAVIFYYERCHSLGWVHGRDFAFCANVHDEAQMECRPEIAEELGKTFADCITEAGVRLGSWCPLAGSFAVGDDWADTH